MNDGAIRALSIQPLRPFGVSGGNGIRDSEIDDNGGGGRIVVVMTMMVVASVQNHTSRPSMIVIISCPLSSPSFITNHRHHAFETF